MSILNDNTIRWIVPVDAETITLNNGDSTIMCVPTYTTTTGTWTMPAAPVDGHIIYIANATQNSQSMTKTLNANTGQTIDGAGAGTSWTPFLAKGWIYRTSTANWYRFI